MCSLKGRHALSSPGSAWASHTTSSTTIVAVNQIDTIVLGRWTRHSPTKNEYSCTCAPIVLATDCGLEATDRRSVMRSAFCAWSTSACAATSVTGISMMLSSRSAGIWSILSSRQRIPWALNGLPLRESCSSERSCGKDRARRVSPSSPIPFSSRSDRARGKTVGQSTVAGFDPGSIRVVQGQQPLTERLQRKNGVCLKGDGEGDGACVSHRRIEVTLQA